MPYENENSARPAAGWYPDPAGGDRLRWWNGSEWTDHLSTPPAGYSAPAQGMAGGRSEASNAQGVSAGYGSNPLSAPPYSMGHSAQPRKLDPGTPVGTWAIWVIALLPIISVLLNSLWDVEDYARKYLSPDLDTALSTASDPMYLTMTFAGFAIYVATVVLAFVDWRILSERGVDRPFHWAWSFLWGIVYVIGRGVVVRRRSGRGLAPMWVYLAIQVVLLIVAVINAVEMVNVMIPMILNDPSLAGIQS